MSPYRYTLIRPQQERWLLACGTLLWVMLNPSVASDTIDDPTIRKCVGFTRRWGFERMVVVNLFAYRATKPAELWKQLGAKVDVVGPENDLETSVCAKNADAICCAWGRVWRHDATQRVERVMELLFRESKQKSLLCVGVTLDGSPKHPLYAGYTSTPRVWKTRKEAA